MEGLALFALIVLFIAAVLFGLHKLAAYFIGDTSVWEPTDILDDDDSLATRSLDHAA